MIFFDPLHELLGIHAEELLISHMIYRSLVVYIMGFGIARFNRRFMSFRTMNDFFLFILIGSVLASAITERYFYETIGMALFIIFINWLVTFVGYYRKSFRDIFEGKPLLLVENGAIHQKSLRKLLITEDDLIALLRIHTNTTDLRAVERAYFENTGEISFVMKK